MKIVLVVTNDLITDWRLHKMCSTLHNHGYQVLLIGCKKKNSLPMPQVPYSYHRIPVIFQKGKLFYIEYTIKIIFYLLSKKPFHIYVANDLDTLFPVFLIAKLKGNRPIVYDAHEYFTGMVDLLAKPLNRKIWKTLEKWLLPRVPYRITVTEGTKKLYEKEYNGQWFVIKNYPLLKWAEPNPPLQSPPSKWILIYHGVIKKGRFLEEIVHTLAFLPKSQFELWIIGKGPYFAQLQQKIQTLPYKDQIYCPGAVPHIELKKYLKKAHIGLCFLNLKSQNYQESLPTKVLDYMAFGIPFLATPVPLLETALQKFPAGFFLPDPDPKTIAHYIKLLTQNLQLYNTFQKNGIYLIQKELNWESQESKIINFYNNITKNA